MTIHLYFSNQLMPLADRLQETMEGGKDAEAVFSPTVIIVPNMNLAKWVKLTLAEKTGIFMNVDFQYLEAGLWQMLTQVSRDDDDATEVLEPELLDIDRLKILIYFALLAPDDKAVAREAFNRYLGLNEAGTRADTQLRCWQLAGEMAGLFQEYAYHRSDMIERWMTAPDDEPLPEEMERSQRWLFRRVAALKTALGQFTGHWLTTPGEYAKLLPGTEPAKRAAASCHFFGLSQISPLHVQLLGLLDTYYDIHIYSLNPSREYWEDIRTPAEKKWMLRKGGHAMQLDPEELASGSLFSEPDHPLLSAWGKPGRESIRLLCQLTDYNFHTGFETPPAPDTVLAAIRYGLLTLEPSDDALPAMAQDTSLQVMASPGIRREVERVYHSIRYNLENDPDLCMTDIAVMVTDMSRYKPVVDSVFSRQPSRITYNLVDAHARTESLFARAVLSLMTLAQGNFSRKAVFDLLRNPLVMRRWAYGTDELAVWIGWAEALGIFHDAQGHTGGSAEELEAGCFTWQQGLQRLRLSRIMAFPTDDGDRPDPHFEGIVPFADMHTGDDRVLGNLCRIIEQLGTAVDTLNVRETQAGTWREAFFEIVEQFIAISSDDRGEETVYRSLVEAFADLAGYDDLMRVTTGRPLDADSLWAFVRTHLDGITGGQGDYLTGGVTVSALMPMRPIPFKIVYILGLEEGRFPGRTLESILDLRGRRRRIGDVSLAERNRYLFLETLISVTGKLYLGYVSRDLQKDRQLAPCSVLRQLIRHVETHVLGGATFNCCEVPFREDSPVYLAPDRLTPWSDILARGSTVARLSGYCRHGLWNDFSSRASAVEMKRALRLSPDFSLVADATEPADVPQASRSLPVGLIRRFLLDPVGVAGELHLGLREPDTRMRELAEAEDEPLASQFPVNYELGIAPLRSWLAGQVTDVQAPVSIKALEERFDALYADRHRKSKVPNGAFADHDQRRLKAAIVTTGTIVAPLVEQMRSARQRFSLVRVGSGIDDPPYNGGEVLRLDPVIIDASDQDDPSSLPDPVSLDGSLPWIWQDEADAWHCLVLTGSGKNTRYPDRYAIAPVLTLSALCAGGIDCPWSAGDGMTLHLVYQGHVLNLDYRLDAELSRYWLMDLIAALSTPPPLLWLPYEVVMGNSALRHLIASDDGSEIDAYAFYEKMARCMVDTADLAAEMIGARVTPDILDHARARFRPFLPRAISTGSR